MSVLFTPMSRRGFWLWNVRGSIFEVLQKAENPRLLQSRPDFAQAIPRVVEGTHGNKQDREADSSGGLPTLIGFDPRRFPEFIADLAILC